jgi:alkylhydroperoxidase family enzyme
MRAWSPSRNDFEASRELADLYGFVPNLFRVQEDLSRIVADEAQLIAAVVLPEGRLSRQQKENLLYRVACARQSEYCIALYAPTQPGGDAETHALLNFAQKLACYGPWISARDIEALARSGFDDQAILGVIATTALGQMLCTLAEGFQPLSDPERPLSTSFKREKPPEPGEWVQPAGPYLKSQLQPPPDFEPFATLPRPNVVP